MKWVTIKDTALILFYWTLVLTDKTFIAAHEKDEFRIYDRNFKASDSQVHEMLKRADLEGKGFTKVTNSHLIVEKNSESKLRRDVHFTKRVPCAQLPRVEREIKSLLPGVWGEGVSSRVRDIVFLKSLEDTQMCTAGIEIHFPSPGCQTRATKRSRVLRQKRRENRYAQQQKRGPVACPDFCVVCFLAEAEQL